MCTVSNSEHSTVWKVSNYGGISGPYFPEKYGPDITFHAV